MELRGEDVNLLFCDMQKEFDPYGAFADFKPVAELKRSGAIPAEYAGYFPDRCPGCGSENILSYCESAPEKNLKVGMCCNPRCRIKQGYSLSEMLSRFGCKGLGEATCSGIYDSFVAKDKYLKKSGREGLFKTASYVEILTVAWDNYPPDISYLEKTLDFYEARTRILQTQITFPVLVSKLALPELDTFAIKVFSGADSLNEFITVLGREGGIAAYCNRRGIYDSKVKFWIKNSLEDLAVAQSLFSRNIRPVGGVEIRICITGRVSLQGTWLTKAEYVNYCNKIANIGGYQCFEIVECTAVESVEFIVCDVITSSAKCRAGLRREQAEKRKILITADDFCAQIERRVAEWKEMNQSLMC